MERSHSSFIVVVFTPKVVLCFKGFDKSIIFFDVRFFWGLVFPSPLVIGLFLLIRWFLGCRFLWGLFLGSLFLFVCLFLGAAHFLLQGVDFGAHCHYLLLVFCGFAPDVFFVQKTHFVLVLSADHEVLCCEGGPPVIALTFEIFDVSHKFLVGGSLVCFP